MKRTEDQGLNEAIRKCVTKCHGEIRIADIVEELRTEHSHICMPSWDQFAVEGLSKRVRDALKQMKPTVLPGPDQLPLFLFEEDGASIAVPAMVSLMPKPGEEVEEGESPYVWRSTADASFRELQGHAKLLETNIKHTRKQLRNLRRLMTLLQPHVAGHEDDPLGPIIRKLAKAK